MAAAPALVFSALLGSITATSDYFWKHRIGLIQGSDPLEDVFSEESGHGDSWIPLTRAYIEENGYTISKSGKYYLAESPWTYALNIGTSDTNKPSVDVTLCFHGTGSAPQVHNGSTLRICDCTYKELEDGTVTGGRPYGCINVSEKCKLIVDSGIISGSGFAIYNHGGEVIINGGTIGCSPVDRAVYSENGGKVTLNDGTIGAGICSKDGGEIVINGGAVLGDANVRRISESYVWAGVWTDNGRITMNNGQIITSMVSENGEVTINNGKIGDAHGSSITNGSGTVIVKGGEIGGIRNGNGTITISGGTIVRYDAGIMNEAGGTVNITGGTISDTGNQGYGISNKGTLNISGGTISGYRSGIENNDGKVNINGGTITGAGRTFAGGIKTTGANSVVNISGGIIQGVVELGYGDSGNVTISNGTIQGYVWNSGNGTVALLIKDDSDIVVDSGNDRRGPAFGGMNNAKEIPVIMADSYYNGDVIYYSSAQTQGTKMTIQEAAMIDYTQPYVRLVATSSSGTLGNNKELTWKYDRSLEEVTITGNGVSAEEPVYAAVYDRNGKMIDVAVITVSDGKANVGNNFDHVKLIRTDSSAVPKCESAEIKASK